MYRKRERERKRKREREDSFSFLLYVCTYTRVYFVECKASNINVTFSREVSHTGSFSSQSSSHYFFSTKMPPANIIEHRFEDGTIPARELLNKREFRLAHPDLRQEFMSITSSEKVFNVLLLNCSKICCDGAEECLPAGALISSTSPMNLWPHLLFFDQFNFEDTVIFLGSLSMWACEQCISQAVFHQLLFLFPDGSRVM